MSSPATQEAAAEIDTFDRSRMKIAAIGFILVAILAGYFLWRGALTPVQTVTLRIAFMTSAIGLAFSLVAFTALVMLKTAVAKVAFLAGLAAVGAASYVVLPAAPASTSRPASEAPSPKGTSGTPAATQGTISPGEIDCDCANTTAPNIGGAATRQCLAGERQLMAAAAGGKLQVSAADGKLSSVTPRCDSVSAGPAAWPTIGGPAVSPYKGRPAPPACPTDTTPRQSCVPQL